MERAGADGTAWGARSAALVGLVAAGWMMAACGAPGRDAAGARRAGEAEKVGQADSASRCAQASAALESPSAEAAVLQRQIADAAISCSEACDGGDEPSCAALAVQVEGICVRNGEACRALCSRARSTSLSRLSCNLSDELASSIERMNKGVEAYTRGDFAAAETDLVEATALSEHNHNAWYNLGQVRERLGNDEQAAAAFGQAVARADDPMYHYRYGKALVGNDCAAGSSSNVERARKHLERAVELEPRLYRAWECLGVVHAFEDRPRLAAEAWMRAAQLNPTYQRPFLLLGKLYIRWRKQAEATMVLAEGARTVQPAAAQADVWYHLGLAYQQQGKRADAAEAYTTALERAPGSPHVLLQRGLLLDDMGEGKRAERDLEAFLEAGGSSSAFELQAAQQRLMQIKARGQ